MRSLIVGLGRAVGIATVAATSLAAQSARGTPDLDTLRWTAASQDGLTLALDSAARQVDPGGSVTLRVTVQNVAGLERNLVMRTILPAGWRLLSGPTDAHLAADARIIRLVQCAVPADAVAGEYRIEQVVSSPRLEQDLRAQTSVIVRARRSLTVALIDEPYFAPTGSSYTATFLVVNRGNVRTRVRLHAKSDRDFSATIDTLTSLMPGETRQIKVVVNTGSSSTSEALLHHVALIADAEGGLADDDAAAPRAVAGVRVIPRNNDAALPWYRLPLNVTASSQVQQLRLNAGGSSQAFQLSGFGPLTEGGSSTIEVLARTPQPSQSLLAERDEYRIAVTGPRYGVQLGDQILSLTPLTQTGVFSSGASGHLELGRWTTGAFIGRDRWMPGSSPERAAFVGIDATPKLHLSANVVESSLYDRGWLGTLDARFRPTAAILLEAEHGRRLAGPGSTGNTLRAAGQHGWLTFDLRHLQADSVYPTSLRGSRQDWATVTLAPTRRFRISGRLADRMNSPLSALVMTSSQLVPSSSAGRTAAVSADFAGKLSAGFTADQDRSQLSATPGLMRPVAERFAWVRMASNLGRLSLSVMTERGTSDDVGFGASRPFSSTSLQVGYRVEHLSVSSFVVHSTGERRYASTSRNDLSGGGSAQLRFAGLSVALAGAGSPGYLLRLPIAAQQSQTSWFDASVGYEWSPGRALEVRVRSVRAAAGMPASSTARISYSVPLGLPVGRSKTISRVTGRVIDAETGLGISNALVRVGDRSALTDDDGNVSFGGMRPDRYRLALDLGARAPGDVGLEDGAAEVTTTAGHTADIAMRVVRFGRITGKLQLFEVVDAPRQPGDSLRVRKAGGLAGVTVLLVNGTEERRVVSDSGGWFELRDARPGRWRIIVPASQLPAQHYVEGDSERVVELGVGASQVVEINVLPRQRRILPLDAVPVTPMIPPGGR